jgi:DNA-binding response OmpR family regulator
MACVLVAGTEPDCNELMQKILAIRGHDSEAFPTVEDALARIPLQRPDLITIHSWMPFRHDLDLCERLRSQRATCQIPLVSVIALPNREYREPWFRSGSNSHLCMPYAIRDFDTAIQHALSWPESLSARSGSGQIVFDNRDEDGRLHQTNDLNVDVLTLTSLTEDEVAVFKKVVLEMGDRLKDWGSVNQCERVASLRWRVHGDRIGLEVRRDRLPQGCPDDPLSMSLDALVRRCGFVAAPGSQTEGAIVLERTIRV